MQVKLESAEGLERRLHVSIPAQEYDQAVQSQLRALGRRVRVDGFRPGKVPLKVLEQRYGGQARQEALSQLLESSYPKALDEVKVQPAGQPKIEFEGVAPGADMSYVAVFDVYPDIELRGLDGMKIESPVTEIVDADVDTVLSRLREQRRTYADKDGGAAEGDRLRIDFSGFIDGELFDGGQGSDVEVEMGAGRFLPDMEAGLLGMAAGEEREITVNFPADYHAEQLQGKAALFKVKVNKLEASQLPDIDDEFCASMGVTEGGEAALREKMRSSLERERDQAARRMLKGQVMEHLLSANPVEVPKAMVAQEIERMRHEAAQRFGQAKLSHEDLHKILPDDMFTEQATRRAALGLLLGEVIKLRELKADAAAVEAKLREMASEFEDAEQAIAYYRSNREFMQNLGAMVLEDQVVDLCLQSAKMKDKKLSFDELTKSASE